MLGLLLLFNLIYSPDFFSLVMREGNLYGSLIDILNFGAPLILVSIGMTLVIATGGIDLSVGSIVAISGAMACMTISKGTDQSSFWLVLSALALSIGLSIVLGVWNGALVSVRPDSAHYRHADSDGSWTRYSPIDHKRTDYYSVQ